MDAQVMIPWCSSRYYSGTFIVFDIYQMACQRILYDQLSYKQMMYSFIESLCQKMITYNFSATVKQASGMGQCLANVV